MSQLLKDQQRFSQMLATIIRAAYARGYDVTFGDAYRDPRASFPYSSPTSFHAKRLAVDLNLFRGGEYLTSVEDWREIGELWEALGGTWGGRWGTGDANHLSLGEGRAAAPVVVAGGPTT